MSSLVRIAHFFSLLLFGTYMGVAAIKTVGVGQWPFADFIVPLAGLMFGGSIYAFIEITERKLLDLNQRLEKVQSIVVDVREGQKVLVDLNAKLDEIRRRVSNNPRE